MFKPKTDNKKRNGNTTKENDRRHFKGSTFYSLCIPTFRKKDPPPKKERWFIVILHNNTVIIKIPARSVYFSFTILYQTTRYRLHNYLTHWKHCYKFFVLRTRKKGGWRVRGATGGGYSIKLRSYNVKRGVIICH